MVTDSASVGLNVRSLAEGDYDNCEKTLARDDNVEPRNERDGFPGSPDDEVNVPTLPPSPPQNCVEFVGTCACTHELLRKA